MTVKYRIKTSRNIGGALKQAIKRNEVDQGFMAHDLDTSSPAISNHTGKFDAPIDMAMKYSTYLDDPVFNQQMAAIYFDAIAMFNPKEWAEQFRDSPYAIWIKLRTIEKERLAMGDDVLAFAMEKRSGWTEQQTKQAMKWMIGLLKTISLASLMAKEFSDVAQYDLHQMEVDFNQSFGDTGR